MAKQPKITVTAKVAEQPEVAPVSLYDLTDEEIAVAAVHTAVEPTELAPLPDATTSAVSIVPTLKPHFVTSMNQTPLAEANRIAREDFAKQRAMLDEAHRLVLVAINKAFAGSGAPMDVMEAAAMKAVDAMAAHR